MNVLQKLQSETIRSELSLIRVEAGARSKILKLLKDLEDEIVGQLTAIDPTHPTMTAYKQARLEKLLKEVKTVTGTAYKKAATTATKELETAAVAATKAFADSINFAVGAKIAKATIPQPLLTKLVDTTLVESAPSSDWWARQPKQLVEKFYDQMRLGLAKGDTLDQLIQRVRGVPARNGQMAKAGIMDVSRRNAAALVRTATQSITNQARIEAMTANRDVVKGVQWLATLDNRTTEICRLLDGKTWRFVSRDSMELEPFGHNLPYPGPTAHWGCRSVVLPWLKSWEEMTQEAGGDTDFARQLDNVSPGTRSSLNGQVPSTMTYEDWLNSIDKDEAVAALGGKANYQLWEDGKLAASPELAAAAPQSRPPRIAVYTEGFESGYSDRTMKPAVKAQHDELLRLFEEAVDAFSDYIRRYTGSDGYRINRWLSSGGAIQLSPVDWLKESHEGLSRMFAEAPLLKRDVTVFSGVQGKLAKSLELYPDGSEITVNRYLSSSLSGQVAQTFVGEYTAAVMQIHIPAGVGRAVYVAGTSRHPTELEMLLEHGIKLKKLGVKQEFGVTVYIMEVVTK